MTLNPLENGFGENTLVWELGESIPDGEVTYTVRLENVPVDGVAERFEYQVRIFDPEDRGG